MRKKIFIKVIKKFNFFLNLDSQKYLIKNAKKKGHQRYLSK